MSAERHSNAIIIQRAFRTCLSTPELCTKYLNSSICSNPVISYDLFIISTPFILHEHRLLFRRLDKFLGQYLIQCGAHTPAHNFFTFSEWARIYKLVHYHRNTIDLLLPTLTTIHIQAGVVYYQFHKILEKLVEYKAWNLVPLRHKKDFFESLVLYQDAITKNAEILHYTCSNSLFHSLFISEKTIKEYTTSTKKQCTCGIFSQWYRNVLFPKEELSYFDVLDPKKYTLFEFFPTLWMNLFSRTTRDRLILPLFWKKRLYTFAQILFEDVVQNEAYGMKEGDFSPIMDDHFNILLRQQATSLFPSRTTSDQHDLQQCFILFHKGTLSSQSNYGRFLKTFFLQFLTHIKIIGANDKISDTDLEIFEEFMKEDQADLSKLYTLFKDIESFLKSKCTLYQDSLSDISLQLKLEGIESLYLKSNGDFLAQTEVLSTMFCILYNRIVLLRRKSLELFFFKDMLRCVNYPKLSSYAHKQLSQWSRLLFDSMPTNNTSATIDKNFSVPFLHTNMPQKIFLYFMADLCKNNPTQFFPEMFFLEWPRINLIFIQISNVTSFLVFHTVIDMFGIDTQKSCQLFNDYRKKYFIEDPSLFVSFSDEDLKKYFVPHEIDLIKFHMHLFSRKQKMSDVYNYFLKKIEGFIFAYDIDNYDKTLSFLDDSLMKDFSRETVFVKIFQCIKHLKNDLFTIRMMFFSMLRVSWKLKENKFRQLIKSTLKKRKDFLNPFQ